jgi:DNA-binding response OmpR family regulator
MAILHVEDSDSVRRAVHRALSVFGFAVVSVEGVGAAKAALAERADIAGALLDIQLRDGSGIDLYHWISAHRPDLAERVAFVTANADAESSGPLAAIGCPVLRKPCEIHELTRVGAQWQGAAGPQSSANAR